MTTLSTAPQRRDLHNNNINYAAAMAGYCAVTHVATGRVCLLPHRHPGPCQLRLPGTAGAMDPDRASRPHRNSP